MLVKRILLAFVVLSVIVVAPSCNKIKDALFPVIDVDLPAFRFTIPPIPIVLNNEASLGSFTVQFNLDSIIKANTANVFGASAVSTVKVKSVSIDLDNADQNNNLANFEQVRFAISSNTRSEAVDIFSHTFPDVFSTSTVITPANSPELKEYLQGSEITYAVFGKARRPTFRSLTFNVTVTISAK